MPLPKPEPNPDEHSGPASPLRIHGNRPSATDDALRVEAAVARCRRGDPEGQRELFELCHRRTYRLAARMVGEREAPDLVQDVFLRVFQKIDQFRGDSRFETWLHRITVNECLQFLRRRGTRGETALLNEPEDRAPERAGAQLEHRELMERALEQLEPDVRSVFLLREVEGMNYAEIAEATQIPEGTVASRLNRARHQLREILVDLGWEP